MPINFLAQGKRTDAQSSFEPGTFFIFSEASSLTLQRFRPERGMIVFYVSVQNVRLRQIFYFYDEKIARFAIPTDIGGGHIVCFQHKLTFGISICEGWVPELVHSFA